MGQVQSHRRPLSWILGILLSLFSANLIIISSLIISSHLSWGLAVASSVMLGLLLVTLAVLYRRWILSWAALIAIVASVLGGMYMQDYADIIKRDILEDLSIAEAVEYPEAGGFTFREGVVRRDMETTYVDRHSNSRGQTTINYYYAAPLVSESWTPSEPVHIFVVAQTSGERENWAHPWRAAIRAAVTFREEFEKAVAVCQREKQLLATSPVLMLSWVEDPQKAIGGILEDARQAVLFWNIFMLSGIFLTWIVLTLRHRKRPPETDAPPQQEGTDYRAANISAMLRFLFVFSFFYLMLFALYFAEIDLSSLGNILLISISAIFSIIASVTLQMIHHKRNGHPADLLLAAVYPFFLYLISFRSFDLTSGHLWMFVGFSLFFIQTGGFILGILLAPVFGWKDLRSLKETKEGVGRGLGYMALLRGRTIFALMLLALWAALLYSLKLLTRTAGQSTALDQILFTVFLLLGVALTTRLTYHASTFRHR